MTSVQMVALRRLTMHGERFETGEKFECSTLTAIELRRSGRAQLADRADLALLLDVTRLHCNGTPLRVTTR